MTKAGIYLELDKSTYYYSIYGLDFYFSSMIYKEKFEKNVQNYVKEESIKLKNKYKNDCDFKQYLAVSLYKKIEKRGFRIEQLNKIGELIRYTKFTNFKCTIN